LLYQDDIDLLHTVHGVITFQNYCKETTPANYGQRVSEQLAEKLERDEKYVHSEGEMKRLKGVLAVLKT